MTASCIPPSPSPSAIALGQEEVGLGRHSLCQRHCVPFWEPSFTFGGLGIAHGCDISCSSDTAGNSFISWTSPVTQLVKNLPKWENLQSGRPGFDPWGGRSPGEERMATHSSLLAWRIPWSEEPGGLQATGSARVGHD